jgi:hypothetical protein
MNFVMNVILFQATPSLIFNSSKACSEDIYPPTSYMEAILTPININFWKDTVADIRKI